MAGALKDSKTRWLGQIPTDWDMVRVKDCFDRKNKKANQKNPIVLSLARSGVKIRDITSNEGQLAADYTNYNPVAKDDILINPMDLVSGDNCNISKIEGVISPAYVNLRYKKGINPRFYNYYFKLQYWLGAFFAHGYGVSFDNRWTLSYETLSKYPIVLPPSEEQDKIADFLDEKCAEIDKLSEDIQKQIDILNDYKKSIITRAVTKGLNPNVKKKDSGQLHIGDIPEEWEIVRVKDVFKMQSGFTPDSKRTDYYDDVNGFNWVTIADINKKSDLPETTKSKISKKYIEAFHPRIAKAGSLLYSFKLSIGQVAFVKKDTYTNEAIISFSCKDTRNLRFLKYSSSLIEYNANTNIYGSKILNQQLIGNAHITLPPIDEQDHIADYLDDFTAKMSDIIDEKNNQLEKIDLYKKSIIYEYVTGKKRVKGAL